MRDAIIYADRVKIYHPRNEAPLFVLMGVNMAFVAMVVFAWAYVALFMSQPLEWATWMPVGATNWRPGLLEYPFTLLWALPTAGTLMAWTMRKSKQYTLAYLAVLTPMFALGLMFGWFYLAPKEWH